MTELIGITGDEAEDKTRECGQLLHKEVFRPSDFKQLLVNLNALVAEEHKEVAEVDLPASSQQLSEELEHFKLGFVINEDEAEVRINHGSVIEVLKGILTPEEQFQFAVIKPKSPKYKSLLNNGEMTAVFDLSSADDSGTKTAEQAQAIGKTLFTLCINQHLFMGSKKNSNVKAV